MDIINAVNRIDRWLRVEEPEFCVEGVADADDAVSDAELDVDAEDVKFPEIVAVAVAWEGRTEAEGKVRLGDCPGKVRSGIGLPTSVQSA